jgi:hypothetical protein
MQAYALNYCPTPNRSNNNNRVRMLKDRWLSLDDKTKTIFDSIDDKFKDIILKCTPSSSPTSSFTPRRGKRPNASSTKSPFNPGRRFYTNLLMRSATNLRKFKKKLQLMTLHYQLTLNLIPLMTF